MRIIWRGRWLLSMIILLATRWRLVRRRFRRWRSSMLGRIRNVRFLTLGLDRGHIIRRRNAILAWRTFRHAFLLAVTRRGRERRQMRTSGGRMVWWNMTIEQQVNISAKIGLQLR